jgi:hypothetical protein
MNSPSRKLLQNVAENQEVIVVDKNDWPIPGAMDYCNEVEARDNCVTSAIRYAEDSKLSIYVAVSRLGTLRN